jgi:hypothetical protein
MSLSVKLFRAEDFPFVVRLAAFNRHAACAVVLTHRMTHCRLSNWPRECSETYCGCAVVPLNCRTDSAVHDSLQTPETRDQWAMPVSQSVSRWLPTSAVRVRFRVKLDLYWGRFPLATHSLH